MEKNYIQEIICKILLLQRQEFDLDISACDRPFLGPSTSNNVYNTRPVQLYNSYTALPWSFTTSDGTSSTIFRIESCEQNCVTVRLLEVDTESGSYVNTGQFVSIDLSTIGAIRCLPDCFVSI